MGREERRAEERRKKADAWAAVSPKDRPWVSRAVNSTLSLQDLERAEYDAYRRGFNVASEDILLTCYASAAMTLQDSFGFDQDQIVDFLCKLDDAVRYNVDSSEKVREAFDRVGVKISFGEPLERVQKA